MKVIHASGKRKRAIARATLTEGKGKVMINNRLLQSFDSPTFMDRITEPFLLAENPLVNIHVKVRGGGVSGQAEACRVAIARALVSFDKKLKTVFDSYDRLLLVADVRRKESRKPNRQSKARARKQTSYR
ncbi:30S ribosomal protein S9 [Candidatus Woesearchaeota archaeon]|nr:30S ribosomal protein S9 [Candidatus Woesearchaeota archaeon]